MSDSILYQNIFLVVSMLLFIIGLASLIFHNNLIKKAVSLCIMDSAVFLLLTCVGYVKDKLPPIVIQGTEASSALYTNPIPTGLVLTGIVVSLSVTAFLLALTVRLYEKYGTVNLDEILSGSRKDGA